MGLSKGSKQTRKMKLIFKLIQAAKKSGGDKYQCTTDDKFIIYVPQNISRQNSKEDANPKEEINITID